ncbi:Leucine-rich repeat extensin-like protein 6 [Linum grandiflorum]
MFLNNQLTGCIPEGIGLPDTVACLNAIEVLNLEHNALSGTLPELVCSLRSLVNLTVAYNFFSGLSQECAKLFVRNVGFDFESNCIPGRDMQRQQPDCSMVPGGGLSCLRFPAAQPLVRGSIVGRLGDADGQPFSSP